MWHCLKIERYENGYLLLHTHYTSAAFSFIFTIVFYCMNEFYLQWMQHWCLCKHQLLNIPNEVTQDEYTFYTLWSILEIIGMNMETNVQTVLKVQYFGWVYYKYHHLFDTKENMNISLIGLPYLRWYTDHLDYNTLKI